MSDIFTLYSKLTFQDDGDGAANTETTAYAAYSPLDRHIHVRSSNREISVGKYVVFHVKSNFALTYFDWIIVSKNLILKSGREYASDIHPGNFLRIIYYLMKTKLFQKRSSKAMIILKLKEGRKNVKIEDETCLSTKCFKDAALRPTVSCIRP